jgi:hypothetical protein
MQEADSGIVEALAGMTKLEIRMTKEFPNDESAPRSEYRHSAFVILSGFWLRNSRSEQANSKAKHLSHFVI